jgi:hypothetical protein
MTWVQDGIFAGGGEALPEGWADFAAQTGITAILHLRPGAPANFRGPTPHSFLWLPVSTEGQADVADRLLAGAFVASCMARGERVLLHASLGRHRTRWAFVAYRIWSGALPHAALRQASQPPWLSPYATDEAAWENLARAVRGHRQELGTTLPLDAP